MTEAVMISWLLITVSIVFARNCQCSSFDDVSNVSAHISLTTQEEAVDKLQKKATQAAVEKLQHLATQAAAVEELQEMVTQVAAVEKLQKMVTQAAAVERLQEMATQTAAVEKLQEMRTQAAAGAAAAGYQLHTFNLNTKIGNKRHGAEEVNVTRFIKSANLAGNVNANNMQSSQFEDISDNQTCQLELTENSISKFRHIVYYFERNYVYLHLKPNSSGVKIIGDRYIVGEDIWVWTIFGRQGGFEFLKWPIEFCIWSMGLLSSTVEQTAIKMELRHVSGDCRNIHVGNRPDDLVISKALKNLTTEIMAFDKEKYGPSFWCYKRRIFIEPHILYDVCKHIVCPIEALKYSCCAYSYNNTLSKREVTCQETVLEYDYPWWIMPMVLAIILFAFCPLVLMKVAHKIVHRADDHLQAREIEIHAYGWERMPQEEIIFFGDQHNYVTLINTICHPLYICGKLFTDKANWRAKFIVFRLIRLFVPLFSLTVIGLQILLDYFYLYTFVLTSLEKGVPLGFRSMIAGYEASKKTFLPCLGGPFVAIGIYLGITGVLMVIPDSLSALLISGLPHKRLYEQYSPLSLSLRTIEMYGSLTIRRQPGYLKLYNAFLAQFYMLININFWIKVLYIQTERWRFVRCCRFCNMLLPFYLVICLLEILICIPFYGFPIISFGLTIIKAYFGKVDVIYGSTSSRVLYSVVLSIILTSSVFIFLFMFSTIFFDATLFFVRIVIFTYTGIIIYPKIAYGYLIFACTVAYYLRECIKEFSLTYDRLLRDTISVCESLQRENNVDNLVVKIHCIKGINKSLFDHIVETVCPRRKQVMLSLLKVVVILGILGISINLLLKIDGVRDLHVVMHVGTTLFVCALPKVMDTMYRETNEKFKHWKHKKELKNNIEHYLGYVTSEENLSSDSE